MVDVKLDLTLSEARTGRRLRVWVMFAALLLTAIAAVVTIAYAGWVWSRTGRQFLPAWLEAVATMAAFVAAVTAVFFAASAFRIESKRELRWLSGQATAQAGLVAAWHGTKEMAGQTLEGVWLRNASELPVMSIRTEVWYAGKSVGNQRRPLLPPAHVPIFVPYDRAGVASLEAARIKVGPFERDPDIEFRFVDSAGAAWLRTRRGKLVRQRISWQ
jgi:hypothetical protein